VSPTLHGRCRAFARQYIDIEDLVDAHRYKYNVLKKMERAFARELGGLLLRYS
jgi:UDP-glucose 4-epimerase